MSQRPTLLLVDDDPGVLDSLTIFLRGQQDYRVRACQSVEEAFEALSERRPSVVLTDISLAGRERGIEVLERARHLYPGIPVVLMSAVASKATAIAAVNSRANHFLEKPFQNQVLGRVLREALAGASGADANPIDTAAPISRAALSRRNNHPGRVTGTPPTGSPGSTEGTGSTGVIGESPALRSTLDLLAKVAVRDSTVLLEGESGVGKSMLARHLHLMSRRRDGPFLTVNCGALAETLLESLLFGHVKGAFTGADRDTEGLVRAADRGTLFLDEVGELSPATQVKLLRVIQEREVLPVGSTSGEKVDVRFVAATNRELRAEVAAGRFREDLYWRLAVVPIRVPALRERPGDIPKLAESVLARLRERDRSMLARGFTDEAMARLESMPWYGNVRELENVIDRATVTAGNLITARDIPPQPAWPEAHGSASDSDAPGRSLRGLDRSTAAILPLALIERAYVEYVLGRVHGDLEHAAQLLGLSAQDIHALIGAPPPAIPGSA